MEMFGRCCFDSCGILFSRFFSRTNFAILDPFEKPFAKEVVSPGAFRHSDPSKANFAAQAGIGQVQRLLCAVQRIYGILKYAHNRLRFCGYRFLAHLCSSNATLIPSP